ncbi:uncharacterized protein RCC_06298 [Ramularia collo-cygni]|uniref:AB hydrolase-1 domain-containing protein n=1 Tax=Ramularia collo-cygni TaxID=112498 RepID=A0A2D3UYB9_9PEZI|nr:uncharacterized protein RCC_06298 [Ramularia collo-cygni]CZT20438.1 uncharacterized protein RCC_06298 [Ramularia collo-cygni]
MFGSRYTALTFDKLAQSTGVRVIYVDRPGFGGSTPVALEQRVQVWLETVPVLLQRLEVKHVALCTHSAGTIYTLNTMLHHRNILSPIAPYVAFMAPWVHSEHSQVALTTALSKLPSGFISPWSDIATFINTKIVPAASLSGGIFSTIANVFQTGSPTINTDMQDKYGDEETGKQIEKLQTKYMFAESMAGGTEEARLCLKSDGEGLMGACENYERYVEVLRDQEKKEGRNDGGPKLKVSLHFAESDALIGKGGKEYFEKCWKQDGVGEVIETDSTEYPGTNHDSVLIDFNKGALKRIFEAIASAHQG